MAGFATFDDVVNAISALGQALDSPFQKAGTAPEASGVWHSLWRVGSFPGAGGDGAAGSGTPGAGGTALTLADGTLAYWADQSGKNKHLLAVDLRASVACTAVLLDRLVSVSGVTLVGTGDKNVNSVALPRYTDGEGVQAFLEITTVTATSAVVGTAVYTDQGGGSPNSSPAFTFPAAATNVDTLIPIGLATGDRGVKSVEKINLTTASGGAGACNVVLAKELCRIPLIANQANTRDLLSQIMSMPRIYDGATLMLAMIATATTATTLDGHLWAAYK
jgi:hypothetical protein